MDQVTFLLLLRKASRSPGWPETCGVTKEDPNQGGSSCIHFLSGEITVCTSTLGFELTDSLESQPLPPAHSFLPAARLIHASCLFHTAGLLAPKSRCFKAWGLPIHSFTCSFIQQAVLNTLVP